MKAIALILTFSAFVHADLKKDTKYELVDRYCSDGSDALDAKLEDMKGGVIEFNSSGKFIVYDEDKKYESDFQLEGNQLTIISVFQKTRIPSIIRSTGEGFLMFSPLPPDAEKARAICSNPAALLVQTFKRKAAQE